jgi:hypothetical protein
VNDHRLSDFWDMPAAERERVLLDAIADTHAWHFARNQAYRHTVAARGIGPSLAIGADAAERARILPRLLRPTAQTFKSYIEVLGTPFAQDHPHAFLNWLADQLSIELPRERFQRFRDRYGSLEALLKDIERHFADLELEVLTSSGTSGRSTIMVRDPLSMDRTVESFYLAFQRFFGMEADHRAIFVMPQRTRIAMARMASFSVKRVGIPDDRVHFAIPFPAEPDHVRIRAGRTFRPGWRGWVEQRLIHRFMNWMQEHYVTQRAVRGTIELLEQAEVTQEKVLVFGGWVQMHAIAQALQETECKIRLAPGSILGTGGGLKERYEFAPAQIRQDLAQVVELAGGQPIPIRDTYGMAEGNWAAMQCRAGHYHIPPWIYARTLDDDDRFLEGAGTTGLLAFYDPFGGGQLFPAFFKTADQVSMIQGQACPCGESGTYLVRDSIQRVDLLDEAGCAAQI